MRSVIACNRCRRAKVKCKHNGHSPCIACQKRGTTETCILLGPDIGPKTCPSPKRRLLKRKQLASDNQHEPGSTRIPSPIIQHDIKHVFGEIERARFVRAATSVQSQFPELGFLHPIHVDHDSEDPSAAQMLRLLTLLAVSDRYEVDLPDNANYILLTTAELHKRIITSPSLDLVQAFLILSVYNWGDGDGFSAWMHAGMACRMAQGLLSTKLPEIANASISEMEKRTLWSCFAIDKLLSCGKARKAMFDLDSMNLPLPSSEEDFIFGDINAQVPLSNQRPHLPTTDCGLDSSFKLITKGLHIWSSIHSWGAEGGRRQRGMTELEQCPWQETSQWNRMKQELQEWRDSQHPRIKYPESKVSSHAHLKQAERFGHLNLIYYVSLLLLCREYIPFLPVGELKPRGPIERPLLKAAGPDAFWSRNVVELFHAATQISNLLKDLRRAGAPLRTPFSGLCAFSSILLNHYAASFPSFMEFAPDQVKQAESQAEESMHDLQETGRVWKVAQDWIEVAETAKSLFHRATGTNGGAMKKSRYDYPDLEDSINLAQLKGMPRPGFSGSAPNSPPLNDSPTLTERRESTETGGVSVSGSPRMQHEGNWSSVMNEVMDEDEWRLWSFWDDPHLLSTVVDPSLGLEHQGDT
ncbi:fungal-specific transcription factor domain-containing protein [Thelonectria olida]|uniref:Fungal-specific transcription factor domain-containing protein n=1 Tax=Thelonectria olida TaxID=1576542 RepID=A0A9P8VZC2_9HYPO|nr:fungal-specific transcription factor domain-containing protein [Thelonectria olida]